MKVDKGRTTTDKELRTMEKKLTGIYSRAEKEVGKRWKEYMDGVNEKGAKLYDDIKSAKTPEGKRLAEKAYKDYVTNATLRNQHYKTLTEQYAKEILDVNKTAVAYVNGKMPDVYATNYNAIGTGIQSQLKGYSFELVDAATVKSLATKDETLLPYKVVNGKKDVRWNTSAVNNEVLQGIIQGESIPDISKRLRNVTEMNLSSSIRNARTSTTSAENRGRMDSFHAAQEKGVVLHKIWMATNDGRTREAHILLDGQEQEIDEPFDSELGPIMYPGDPNADPANVYNCRCTMVTKVLGFGEAENVSEDGEDEYVESLQSLSDYSADFVPAVNVAEAEAYADKFVSEYKTKYTGTASYKGMDVEYANTVNRVLTTVNAKYDIDVLDNIKPMNFRENIWKGSTSDAAYQWGGNGTLFFNPNFYKTQKALEAHIKEANELLTTVLNGADALLNKSDLPGKTRVYVEALKKSGIQCVAQSASDFAEATFVHECGHMLEDKAFGKLIKQAGIDIAQSMDDFAKGISGYATASNREYIAESFCSFWYGKTENLDPALVDVFRKAMK